MRRGLLLVFLTVALGFTSGRATAEEPRVFVVFFQQWSANPATSMRSLGLALA